MRVLRRTYDYIIVGAGLFGSVMAERIAALTGYSVLVIEKRNHIGGNCYSETDPETEIEFHKYGPHIFHTSSYIAWEYVHKFADFTSYCHRVMASYKNNLYPFPVTLSLINRFFGLKLTPAEAGEFMAGKRVPIETVGTFEDLALSSIGRELYEAFFENYTLKQWGRSPGVLPAENFARIPVRLNYNESYYNDTWCGMPMDGYSAFLGRLLGSQKIKVSLNTDFFEVRNSLRFRRGLIYTGPLDRFFHHCEGRLSYRTVDIFREVHPIPDLQGVSVVNYPEPAFPYTRIVEPRHFHPERHYRTDSTLIFKEVPRDDDGVNPFYPVNGEEDKGTLMRYQKRARAERNVIFGGRLGTYRYLDMDKVILSALRAFQERIVSLGI
ncbi:MAG: UDP-galactopyranose mutase [Armatimonadetes bacterium]|nr:UDP-galactopyranose mutase [Armatimonadota bacterium]